MKLQPSRKLYGNITALRPGAETPLFKTNGERARWYVEMGLGVMEKPDVLRLNFEPRGPGHSEDPYFLQDFSNRCVVCGSEGNLSHHHIVPDCYRRYFPRTDKECTARWMYDVLLLCVVCHERYEKRAWEFKIEISREFGVPESGETNLTKEMFDAIRAAAALHGHGTKMPEKRRLELEAAMRAYFGYDPDPLEYKRIWIGLAEDVEHIPAGRIIVERHVKDVDDFAIRWRRHFVKMMKPAFLPELWEVERRIYV